MNLSYVEHAKRYRDRLRPLQKCCLYKCLHEQQQQDTKPLRTRNTAVMHSWGKFWTMKIYKKAKTQPATTSEMPAAGSHAWSLHPVPARGWAAHQTPLAAQLTNLPTLTPFGNQPTYSGNNKDICCLFLHSVLQLSPSKASPESLPLSSYRLYWLKSPRTCLGNCLHSYKHIQLIPNSTLHWKSHRFSIQWPKMLVLCTFYLWSDSWQSSSSCWPHIAKISIYVILSSVTWDWIVSLSSLKVSFTLIFSSSSKFFNCS